MIQIVLGLFISLNSVANELPSNTDPTDPVWVVNQIFIAANNGDYKLLVALCDPEGQGDGDTRQICEVHAASDKTKDEFKMYFKLGRVVGKSVVTGDSAKVKIKFGPKGDKDETMNLVKRGKKWYLSSF